MKTIYFSTYTFVPDEVLKAFCHIKEHFPDLQKVEYDKEGNWTYYNTDGSSPVFDDKIDVSLLEIASDRAYISGYPVCFSLFIEKELAVCNVHDKPKVTLTQTGCEKYEVTVGPGATTEWSTLDLALSEFTESINSYVKE